MGFEDALFVYTQTVGHPVNLTDGESLEEKINNELIQIKPIDNNPFGAGKDMDSTEAWVEFFDEQPISFWGKVAKLTAKELEIDLPLPLYEDHVEEAFEKNMWIEGIKVTMDELTEKGVIEKSVLDNGEIGYSLV